MSVAIRPLFRLFSRLVLCLLVGVTGLLVIPDRASASGIVGAGTIENTSSDIAYSGTWTTASSGSDSGGPISTLAGTGYAEVTFRETSVKWVARTANFMGIANVYLDGTKVTTVDLYSAANGFKKTVYTSPTLSYGTHTLRVERTGTKSDASSGRNIDVDAFVVPDSQAPATPAGLQAAADGAGATLGWTANGENDLAGYLVYRASDTSTSYTKLTADPVTGTSYTDPALTPGGSYRYQLSAVDKTGNESGRTGDVAVTSNSEAVPAATYENTAKQIVYSGTWASATSGSDSGGSISTLAGTGYAQIAFKETAITWVARKANYLGIANVYLDGAKVATVDLYSAANQFKQSVYTSPTLSYGTHTLRVERSGDKNAASSGRTVDVDSFVVLDSRPPAAPTGVAGEPSGADAKVSWTASPDSDVVGYLVYRAEGTSTSYTKLSDTPVTGTTLTDPGPTPATVYRYRVTAVDRAGNESSPTDDVKVTTLEAVGSGVYENTDAGLSYSGSWTTSESDSDSKGSSTLLAGTGWVQLSFKETSFSWIARTGDYLGIANVWIDGQQVATVDLYSPDPGYRSVVYVSPTLSYGVHTVRIERSGNKNAASSGRSINLDKLYVNDTRAPATPTGLRGEPNGAALRLRWDAGTEPDIAGYLVYRASGTSTDYQQLTEDPTAGSTFLDPNVTPNTTYRYHLVVVDDSDNRSDPTADVVTRSAVSAGTYKANDDAVTRTGSWDPSGDDPTVLTASATGSASLTFNETNVRWIGPKGPQGGIAKVYLDDDLVASVDQYAGSPVQNATLFTTSGLSGGSHTLRVAWSSDQNSAGSGRPTTSVASFVVGDTTPPDAPQEIFVEPGGDGVRVQWAASNDRDVIGYRLYHSEGNDRDYTLVDADAIEGTEAVDDNLVPGSTYWYRVTAVDASGNESVKSPSAAATTPLSTGTVENASRAVIYNTTWSTSNAVQDSGGSYATGTATGASATLTFSGTGIKWLTRTNNYSGIASVSIDGTPVQKVDLYTPTQLFKQPVFTQLNLPDGTHVIKVERTGTLNARSTGRGISLDTFEVLDSTAPVPMPAPSLSARRTGIQLDWDASTSADVVAYRLYRTSSDGAEIQLDRVPSYQRSYTDVGLPSSTTFTYRVTAIDSSGNESAAASASKLTLPSPPDVEVAQRYSNCPTATRTVSTTGTLQNALSTAKPGDVIRLAPGTYTGPSTITAKGDPQHTIWVCGPPTAVVDFGDYTRGTAFSIRGASYVTLTGMTVRNVDKGVFVTGGDHVVVSDMTISNTGEEAVHLKANTVDSSVVGNDLSNTGRLNPAYGEGVYVGSDPSVWCDSTNCDPDRSDRNQILDNTISGTTAEGVEAKAGTSDGIIEGNVIDGTRMTTDTSGGWVVIKGNGYLVDYNRGLTAVENGFTATYSKAPGWGGSNVFVHNLADLRNDVGYGVWMQKNIGNVAGCYNNTADGARVTNLPCQR